MSEIMSDSSSNITNDQETIESLRQQFITRGLTGLVNLGNTCYMNSAIQCLSATDILVTYFMNNDYKKDLKYAIIKHMSKNGNTDVNINDVRKLFKNSLTYKMRNVLILMWRSNCKIKPVTFKNSLGEYKKTFMGYNQNDSQECLSYILDQIHEETKTGAVIELKNLPSSLNDYVHVTNMYESFLKTKTDQIMTNEYEAYKHAHPKEHAFMCGVDYWENFIKNNHSVIIDIFTGLFFTEIKCKTCEYLSFNYEPFSIISLPIQQGNNALEQCLDNTFNCVEFLTDDNKYMCNKCKTANVATKKTNLWFTPQILIIQFKRFISNGMMTFKNGAHVKFPINGLNMEKYLSPYITGDCTYDLYAVIHHMGNLNGGHYVAYTKNPINNNWFLFNDACVMHIDDHQVEKTIVNGNAYVLCYKKRSNFVSTKSIDTDCDDLL